VEAGTYNVRMSIEEIDSGQFISADCISFHLQGGPPE
jgi:hypothetical protein